MVGSNRKDLSIVFVYYNGNLVFLNCFVWFARILGFKVSVVIVNNSKYVIRTAFNVIIGSNTCQDFSGYFEGLNFILRKEPPPEYILFCNDTVNKRRFAFGSRFFMVLLEIIRLKFVKNKVSLIGELSGHQASNRVFDIAVDLTFSSYLFVIKTEVFREFMCKYFNLTKTIVNMENNAISSNHICESYINDLNGYLGFVESGTLGRWYNAESAGLKVKLDKARCLVLERILPTYCLQRGEVRDLYGFKPMRVIRKLEHVVFSLWF